MKSVLWVALGLAASISCSSLVIDRSISAMDAGDYVLAVSACEAVPAGGMDVCRVRENTDIDSSWKLVVPAKGGAILGWEVDVYYRDVLKPVTIQGSGPLIEIPWKSFFGQAKWTMDLSGEALALVSVRYKDATGIEQIVKFRGFAKILVLKEGYDRLPIDSGFMSWGATCKVQYTTAGRGVVSCK